MCIFKVGMLSCQLRSSVYVLRLLYIYLRALHVTNAATKGVIVFLKMQCYCRQNNFNRIVVDPSLYSKQAAPLYYAVETREVPTTFDIFEGWLINSFALYMYNVLCNFQK